MGTIPASENVFPILRMAEGAAPSTPPTGEVHLYAKSDGTLYWKDDAGTEYSADVTGHLADTTDAHDASAVSVLDTAAVFTATNVETALKELYDAVAVGGIPATIIDAAGDLIVGTAADTAARLAIGNAGAHLSRINGALAWDSGTAFPTAAAGDRFWRTDRGQQYYYDGTRWLTTTLYHLMYTYDNENATTAYGAPSGTLGGVLSAPAPALGSDSDVWLDTLTTRLFVNGGTALSGSHKWVGVFNKTIANNTTTTLVTINVDSGASSTWRTDSQSIGALLNNGTTHYVLPTTWTKTGTPGPIFALHDLTYRMVG